MRMIRAPLQDLPPPHGLHARLAALHATTFLLESRDGPDRLARHSFVGWAPAGTVRLARDRLEAEGALPAPRPGEAPLAYLRRVLAEHPAGPGAAADLPFCGGLVGVAGFDLARTFEPTLEGHAASHAGEWPRLLLGLFHDAVVYDHAAGTAEYVSAGADRRADLGRALATQPDGRPLAVGPLEWSQDDAAFAGKVREAIRLAEAGECFQVVLSRSVSAPFTGPLAPLYAWLRGHANAPHLFFLRFGDRQLVGASPETLVRVRGGVAETFPIAGTRPAGASPAETGRLAAELAADRKDAAEHAMLVDLARNDLSRVCAPGTVAVARYRAVERFRHVQHLVSEVRGTLAPGRDALDAFAAVFPAGTVSGAPKVRAVEHLTRLEGAPRGPYGGAVLYASFGGSLDSAIAIRSLSAEGGRLRVQAGAGIVLASDPQAEADETRHKMATLLEGLQRFAAPLTEAEAA